MSKELGDFLDEVVIANLIKSKGYCKEAAKEVCELMYGKEKLLVQIGSLKKEIETPKYKVDSWNNFCMVFELPIAFAKGFCHGGGHKSNFQMIDWFYPVPDVWQAAVSKEVYEEKVGPIKTEHIDIEELKKKLIPFLKDKLYVKEGRKYIVVCDFGATIMFDKNGEVTSGQFIRQE